VRAIKAILIAVILLITCTVAVSEAEAPELPIEDLITISEPVTVSEGQIDPVYLLASLIWAEARGEPFEGQVAVGAVVMNRVESPQFPGTIQEVIRQKGQFAKASDKFSLETLEAAEAALRGKDPTGGALYFYNPNLTTDTWIFTRETLCVIGNHRFAI